MTESFLRAGRLTIKTYQISSKYTQTRDGRDFHSYMYIPYVLIIYSFLLAHANACIFPSPNTFQEHRDGAIGDNQGPFLM